MKDVDRMLLETFECFAVEPGHRADFRDFLCVLRYEWATKDHHRRPSLARPRDNPNPSFSACSPAFTESDRTPRCASWCGTGTGTTMAR